MHGLGHVNYPPSPVLKFINHKMGEATEALTLSLPVKSLVRPVVDIIVSGGHTVLWISHAICFYMADALPWDLDRDLERSEFPAVS